MSEVIDIDKYEPTLVKGKTVIYAVKGKTKYVIPNEFADMCDEDHLAIVEVTTSRPELFNVPDSQFYVPLFKR